MDKPPVERQPSIDYSQIQEKRKRRGSYPTKPDAVTKKRLELHDRVKKIEDPSDSNQLN